MLDHTAATKPAKKPLVKRMKKAVNAPGKWANRSLEQWLGRNSLVPDTPIIDKTGFPFIAQLEANWQTIRAELEGVMGDRERLPTMQYISKTQKKIIKDTSWKTYFFFAYGLKAEANCARCPETTKLLEQIPDLEVAFFSILGPKSHISAHRGVYKGLLRVHLALIVPEPSADVRMSVGDAMVYWREGEAVMFDDTYRHEVWNDTDGVRVVLLLDVHRPLRSLPGAVNRGLLKAARRAPFVTEAVRQFKAWEKDYYGRNS